MSRASEKLKGIGSIVGGMMLEMKLDCGTLVSVEKGRLRRA